MPMASVSPLWMRAISSASVPGCGDVRSAFAGEATRAPYHESPSPPRDTSPAITRRTRGTRSFASSFPRYGASGQKDRGTLHPGVVQHFPDTPRPRHDVLDGVETALLGPAFTRYRCEDSGRRQTAVEPQRVHD